MSDCLFCKFASGDIPVDKVYEDDKFFIIRDINPMCKNHFLAIPKSHYKYLSEMTSKDAVDVAYMLSTLPKLSEILELKNGFRLVVNQGDDAQQSVPHLHIHILSGEKMGWNPAGR